MNPRGRAQSHFPGEFSPHQTYNRPWGSSFYEAHNVYLRPCRLKNKYLLAVAVFYYVHLPQTKGKLKQVGKNGILVVEDIKIMNELFLFLDKMKKSIIK